MRSRWPLLRSERRDELTSAIRSSPTTTWSDELRRRRRSPEPAVTVEITGLSLYTRHGVSEAERELGQRLVIDVVVRARRLRRDGDRPGRGHGRLRRGLRAGGAGRAGALVPDARAALRRDRRAADRTATAPSRSGSRRPSPSRRSRCRWRRSPSRSGRRPRRPALPAAAGQEQVEDVAPSTGPNRLGQRRRRRPRVVSTTSPDGTRRRRGPPRRLRAPAAPVPRRRRRRRRRRGRRARRRSGLGTAPGGGPGAGAAAGPERRPRRARRRAGRAAGRRRRASAPTMSASARSPAPPAVERADAGQRGPEAIWPSAPRPAEPAAGRDGAPAATSSASGASSDAPARRTPACSQVLTQGHGPMVEPASSARQALRRLSLARTLRLALIGLTLVLGADRGARASAASTRRARTTRTSSPAPTSSSPPPSRLLAAGVIEEAALARARRRAPREARRRAAAGFDAEARAGARASPARTRRARASCARRIAAQRRVRRLAEPRRAGRRRASAGWPSAIFAAREAGERRSSARQRGAPRRGARPRPAIDSRDGADHGRRRPACWRCSARWR